MIHMVWVLISLVLLLHMYTLFLILKERLVLAKLAKAEKVKANSLHG
jgi:hypothetical protein